MTDPAGPVARDSSHGTGGGPAPHVGRDRFAAAAPRTGLAIAARRTGLAIAARRTALAAAAFVAGLTTAVCPAGPASADPTAGLPWYLAQLHADRAGQLATGAGVIVAVIDSGVDGDHPDLRGRVRPGLDLIGQVGTGPAGWSDPVGHGTAIASLIAGGNDAMRQMVGLAPGATILPVRVLDEQNRYHDPASVAAAVRWSVGHGARVVNLSLGAAAESPEIAAAVGEALARDTVVVACTGNRGVAGSSTVVWYPARAPGVVATAGLAPNRNAWAGSLTGPQVALSAPADDLVAARPGGGYWRVAGTSYAAALVTAAVALVRSHWPAMTAANVINRLVRTAHDLGPPGRDPQFGFGEVDPAAALGVSGLADVARNPLDASAGLPQGRTSPVRPIPRPLLVGGLVVPPLVLAVVLRRWPRGSRGRHTRPTGAGGSSTSPTTTSPTAAWPVSVPGQSGQPARRREPIA
jgi:type VII secretion-associated serine protease mycosin